MLHASTRRLLLHWLCLIVVAAGGSGATVLFHDCSVQSRCCCAAARPTCHTGESLASSCGCPAESRGTVPSVAASRSEGLSPALPLPTLAAKETGPSPVELVIEHPHRIPAKPLQALLCSFLC